MVNVLVEISGMISTNLLGVFRTFWGIFGHKYLHDFSEIYAIHIHSTLSDILSMSANPYIWSRSKFFINVFLHTYSLKKKSLRKTLWKRMKLLKRSNFNFFHNVFYTICTLKSFNSQFSVVFCSFFEFGMVSKSCIREWVKCPGIYSTAEIAQWLECST